MGAGCQLVSGHFPPITVLEKEFTIQTLAAMALAVYIGPRDAPEMPFLHLGGSGPPPNA